MRWRTFYPSLQRYAVGVTVRRGGYTASLSRGGSAADEASIPPFDDDTARKVLEQEVLAGG